MTAAAMHCSASVPLLTALPLPLFTDSLCFCVALLLLLSFLLCRGTRTIEELEKELAWVCAQEKTAREALDEAVEAEKNASKAAATGRRSAAKTKQLNEAKALVNERTQTCNSFATQSLQLELAIQKKKGKDNAGSVSITAAAHKPRRVAFRTDAHHKSFDCFSFFLCAARVQQFLWRPPRALLLLLQLP